MKSLSHSAVVIAVLSLLFLPPAEAANRFFFEDQTVLECGKGVEVFLRADVDQPTMGFSFGVNYDETKMTVTAVDVVGTAIPPDAPEFFDGKIDAANGLIGYGCVLDFGQDPVEPFGDTLQPGTNLAIARIVVDVTGAAGSSSQIVLEDVPTNPDPLRPVKNVMTNDKGESIKPPELELRAGTISISSCAAEIDGVAPDAGPAGTAVRITGKFFDQAPLTVEICGKPVTPSASTATTIDATAPACDPGPATVKVCNKYGCDTATFTYPDIPPPGGIQKPNDENQDGKLDLSDPVSILNHLFLGTNPSLPCGDGTTNDPGNKALLDANGDGKIDLSDPVRVLNFLFLGGPRPVSCTEDSCPCQRIVGCPDNSAKCPS
ncbi:MAG: hypothetical protein HY721_12130 [Planctomycetes bacterium]|nr:hypothetical protein [Planctomycetota bacterium]